MGCAASKRDVVASEQTNKPVGRVQTTVQQYSETVKPVKATPETFKKFLELEEKIERIEASSLEQRLDEKRQELADIGRQKFGTEASLAEVNKQLGKSPESIDSLLKKTDGRERTSQEEEQLQLLTRKEGYTKEIQNYDVRLSALKIEIDTLEKENGALQLLYKEYDELLAGLFNGQYGSDLENTLEGELDTASERRQRINIARQKWESARWLIQYACTQLSYCVQQSKRLLSCSQNDVNQYAVATDIRNNILAATQNITNAQMYIAQIPFPYCKPPMVKNLQDAASQVYHFNMGAIKSRHALFQDAFEQADRLLQWISQVLQNIIIKDIQEADAQVQTFRRQLKQERARLIREKVKELNGHSDIELPDMPTDSPGQFEQLQYLMGKRVNDLLKESFAARSSVDEVRDEIINEIWENFDKDQSGALDAAEIAEFLREFLRKSSLPEAEKLLEDERGLQTTIKRIFEQYDTNNDNVISRAEMKMYIQSVLVELGNKTESEEAQQPNRPVTAFQAPTREQLFGHIEAIKMRTANANEQVAKADDISKTRQQLELQEKLSRRRNRKRAVAVPTS